MKERPILFSSPMVRAILAGTKTVTRRICKVPAGYVMDERDDGQPWPWYAADVVDDPDDAWLACPYGKAGDRLWVKETWSAPPLHDRTRPSNIDSLTSIRYAADGIVHGRGRDFIDEHDRYTIGRLRPSIFMMRWMSRITLDVTSVRVERLHEITEEDARAEGADTSRALDETYRHGFRSLWCEINGAESWKSNPSVWVVSFKRVEAGR